MELKVRLTGNYLRRGKGNHLSKWQDASEKKRRRKWFNEELRLGALFDIVLSLSAVTGWVEHRAGGVAYLQIEPQPYLVTQQQPWTPTESEKGVGSQATRTEGGKCVCTLGNGDSCNNNNCHFCTAQHTIVFLDCNRHMWNIHYSMSINQPRS